MKLHQKWKSVRKTAKLTNGRKGEHFSELLRIEVWETNFVLRVFHSVGLQEPEKGEEQ